MQWIVTLEDRAKLSKRDVMLRAPTIQGAIGKTQHIKRPGEVITQAGTYNLVEIDIEKGKGS